MAGVARASTAGVSLGHRSPPSGPSSPWGWREEEEEEELLGGGRSPLAKGPDFQGAGAAAAALEQAGGSGEFPGVSEPRGGPWRQSSRVGFVL